MDSLGDRMKHNYEDVFKIRLPYRMPVIIRLDGKAFHSLKVKKPFDKRMIDCMDEVALRLFENIQGAVLAYIQSDEISILLHNYKKFTSQAWFDNELQKMVSVSAAIASSYFSWHFKQIVQFDSRVFVLPEAEVCNYFIWRQQDWERNSIQMLAQSMFSHKDLFCQDCEDLKKMCREHGQPWEDLENSLRKGRCVRKADNNYQMCLDKNIPLFKENRNYINNFLKVEEE